MSEPKWLMSTATSVMAVHDKLISDFGGTFGIRDPALLQAALARPKNYWAYEQPSIPQLAAVYAFGICQNHAFLDGNKRTALGALALFLEKNGYRLIATESGAVVTMAKVAAREMTETELADWIGSNIESTN